MNQDSVDDRLLREAVLLELPSGRARYLIDVEQDPCEDCASGTRVSSIWVSAQGKAELVAWCTHCFNATCDPVVLDQKRQQRLEKVREAINAGRVTPAWGAARPAVEDLKRRGIL